MTITTTSATQAASQCPHLQGATPSLLYDDAMFPALAEARRSAPVYHDPATGFWVVTRHADVAAVLQDPERFSARNAAVPLSPLHEDVVEVLRAGGFTPEKTISSIDPPRHTRLRQAFNPQLNPAVARRLEADIVRIVEAEIDKLAAKLAAEGQVDLIADFTYELPARVIFLLLGIPEEDVQTVKQLATGRLQIDFTPSTRDQQMAGSTNLMGLWKYTCDLVQDRIRNPREDFTSGLLALRNGDDAVLSINEINTITYGIVFAGHETTTNQLTNCVREMLLDRPNWEAVCEDPGLAANAIEEGLRHCGSVIGWRRTATQDVELGGVTIPAEAPVLLSLASANRDEAVFEDPERFDVRRKNARRHLTLGAGIHFCLGAPLTRLEMKLALEALTRRFPTLRPVAGAPVEHIETFILRAPERLMVELGA